MSAGAGGAGREPEQTDLKQRLRAGDETALAEVVERWWPALVTYARRLTGDPDAADDIAQQAIVRLWEHRERWTEIGSLEALLFTIARNGALDNARREVRNRRGSATTGPRAEPTPAQHLDAAELERAAEAAIAALPPARREVFLLVRLTDLTYADIAELLAIAPQTVANHMRLALADLRVALGLLPERRIPD